MKPTWQENATHARQTVRGVSIAVRAAAYESLADGVPIQFGVFEGRMFRELPPAPPVRPATVPAARPATVTPPPVQEPVAVDTAANGAEDTVVVVAQRTLVVGQAVVACDVVQPVAAGTARIPEMVAAAVAAVQPGAPLAPVGNSPAAVNQLRPVLTWGGRRGFIANLILDGHYGVRALMTAREIAAAVVVQWPDVTPDKALAQVMAVPEHIRRACGTRFAPARAARAAAV